MVCLNLDGRNFRIEIRGTKTSIPKEIL